MKLSNKAQSSLETLLLIFGAVFLALIVGLTLKNIFNAQQDQVPGQIADTAEDVGGN